MKTIITRKYHQDANFGCKYQDIGNCLLNQGCMTKSAIYDVEVTATLDDNTDNEKRYIRLHQDEF